MYLLRKYAPNVPEETLQKLTHGAGALSDRLCENVNVVGRKARVR